ncbi:MAG TPA: LacI family DNA-binding transcriptional regulator [Chloroflexota bacterium]|nr:LacI family DNA-binding transcriptional regulator [Chloroflexota bacterium]
MSRRERDLGNGSGGRVTIQDIAQQAGVSIATVSRVLNDHPDVSAVTRDEVLRSARELGYSVTRRGDGRTGRRMQLIALSVPEVRGDYVTAIITGAVEALRDRDARLVICPGDDAAMRDGPLSQRLLQGTTDGALLILNSEVPADLQTLVSDGYPVVIIDPITPVPNGIPAVATTNWASAKAATEYLIGLGHTHIGLIAGRGEARASADRVAGYQAALLAAGLPIVPTLVREADWSIDGGLGAAHELLALPHRPTAIFALNDAMAVGVVRAARERKLSVPHDLSIVGFDDVELASITVPPLTTVRQPLQGLGRMGVDVLYRLLQGQHLDATRIELSASLVVRESTAPPAGTSFLT